MYQDATITQALAALETDYWYDVDHNWGRTAHELYAPEGVFAIGDVAATDPNRSSARNWGWRTTVTNVRAYLRGGRMKAFKAPEYRWGSVLGVQEDGMVIVQPDGKRTRVPRAIAERYLVGAFVTRFLYRGLRPHRD